MHECSHPHPRSTQQKKKKRKKKGTTVTEAYAHTHEGLHCVHERKGGLERRCFTFDLVEGRFVEDCARRSMKVLSFNMSCM